MTTEADRDHLGDAGGQDVGDEDEWDGGHGLLDGGTARSVLAYLVRHLVEDASAVRIDVGETRRGIKLSLHVAPNDAGKMIGRGGRVAQAMRTVVRAAGAREGADVVVDIVD
jgi:predicted RNA-binding protein YlqC (UPF0109 family)